MIIKKPFSNLVINWFHTNGRKNLPWKIKKNFYFTWISEIMLQQTQVKTVIPFFLKFIKKFPTIQVLSNASINEILNVWSGLGYYTRARNIYKVAQIIKKKQYKFPDNFYKLIKLPGIGKTTAGSILSFSKGYCFPILDGNVKRILIRYYSIKTSYSNYYLEQYLWKIIKIITPIYNTDKFNQGIIDIGSLICKPRNPQCNICPLNIHCITYKKQNFVSFNTKKNNKHKKKYWFILIIYKNLIWLEQRKHEKIWNGLFCFPSFKTKKEVFLWIKNKNIYYKKINQVIEKKQYNISNFKLSAFLSIIKINRKKNWLATKDKIWFNFLKSRPIIGLPVFIHDVIKQIKNKKLNINMENTNEKNNIL